MNDYEKQRRDSVIPNIKYGVDLIDPSCYAIFAPLLQNFIGEIGEYE